MDWIFGVVALVMLLSIIVAIMFYCVMKKVSIIKGASTHIVNKFEPDNTAPKITEMIDFFKTNGDIKYKV